MKYQTEMYWSTAQQIQVARRMLDLVLKERMTVLEAFRKAASESPKPHRDISTVSRLPMLSRGFFLARFQVEQELKNGMYFRPRVTNLLDLLKVDAPLGVHVGGIEKRTSEYEVQERKPYILIVGILPGQENFFHSQEYDFRFWTKDDSLHSLGQLARGASHTIVWVSKVKHEVSWVVKKHCSSHTRVYGGLSSIQEKVSVLH